MKDLRINDKVIRLLTRLESLEARMQAINDWGESTGYCQEQDAIVNELHSVISAFSAGTWNLIS